MREKKVDTVKINELADELPEFCHGYIYEGQTNHGAATRLAYTRDIGYFFNFIIDYLPYYPEKKPVELTVSDLSKITISDINKYLSWMEDVGISDSTRNRRKSAVSTMFNYLVNTERVLSFNPVENSVKIGRNEREYVLYLNMDEQNKLLNCIRYGAGLTKRQLASHKIYMKRDLAIIFLFLDTGLRISELNGLNIEDVQIFDESLDHENDECFLIVLRKGKKTRKSASKVYFSDEAKEYLLDYLNERKNRGDLLTKDSPLFCTTSQERLAVRSIQAMLNKYVTTALPEKTGISPHKLRSSFAMEFYKHNGKDILVLQQRMGHKTITATNIYAHAAEQDEAVKKSRNWR